MDLFNYTRNSILINKMFIIWARCVFQYKTLDIFPNMVSHRSMNNFQTFQKWSTDSQYYEHRLLVIRRCSFLIRRVVATSRSKGVRLQSWVVGHSHIVTRTTERTRTLHFGGIHPRYRTEYFLIETSLLQPLLFSRSGFIVSLFRASCERCLMTRRDAAESIHSFERKWLN